MNTRTNLLVKAISTLASLFVFSGCASIVSDTIYPVTVGTFVPNANFVIKDDSSGNIVHMGTTPQSVVLSSSSGFFQAAKYKIELEKDGYQKSYHYLNAEIDPWYFGNFIFGGLIGLVIVDPLTGAMWKLPEHVTIGLYPLPPSQVTHSPVGVPNPAQESLVKRTSKGVKHEAPPRR